MNSMLSYTGLTLNIIVTVLKTFTEQKTLFFVVAQSGTQTDLVIF